jgi:hypothetical protein
MINPRKAGVLPRNSPIYGPVRSRVSWLVQLLSVAQRYTAMMGVAAGAPEVGKAALAAARSRARARENRRKATEGRESQAQVPLTRRAAQAGTTGVDLPVGEMKSRQFWRFNRLWIIAV